MNGRHIGERKWQMFINSLLYACNLQCLSQGHPMPKLRVRTWPTKSLTASASFTGKPLLSVEDAGLIVPLFSFALLILCSTIYQTHRHTYSIANLIQRQDNNQERTETVGTIWDNTTTWRQGEIASTTKQTIMVGQIELHNIVRMKVVMEVLITDWNTSKAILVNGYKTKTNT
jgi:hypothetical protein